MISKRFQYEIDCWGLLEVQAEKKAHRKNLKIAMLLEKWATAKHNKYRGK